ncbi:hypothetical protein [Rhizobium sp.]
MTKPDIVFDGSVYRIRARIAKSASPLIVTFAHYNPRPTADGEGYGEAYLAKRGYDFVCIHTKANDWYQSDEFDDVVRVVRPLTSGRRAVGYGGSMGGYGAINHAQALGLTSVVAVCPQFAIGRLAPWEYRWKSDAEAIAFKRHNMEIPQLREGIILCDPWCMDGVHARHIMRHQALKVIPVYGSDHHPGVVLNQCGVLDELMQAAFVGDICWQDFQQRYRRGRAKSMTWLLCMGEQLAHRRHPKMAMRLADIARELGQPADFDQARMLGSILFANGRPGDALASILPWIEDPTFGAWARKLTTDWSSATR